MDARVSIDKIRNLTYLEGKGSLFKSGLHLPRTEHAEVASLCGRSALTKFFSESAEVFIVLDLIFKRGNVCNGLILRSGDHLVAVGVVGVARTNVLLKNVANTDL